ncbi:MAG: electron transfer flavoprotein subunit beta/FixA family protein [bacterium]
MRLIALLKEVPDTGTKPDIANGQLVEDTIKWVPNPYDEYAVEEAVRVRDANPGSELILVTVGKDRARKTMEKILAMGPDRGALIWDDALDGADSAAIATVLKAAIAKLGGADLIFAGQQGVDFNNGLTPIFLAEQLGIPHINLVVKLEVDAAGGTITATQEIDGGEERVSVSLPAIITAQKGLNEPRYPSLKDIMAVKKKQLDKWGLADIDLTRGQVTSKVSVRQLVPPPPKQAGRILQGDSAIPEVIRFIKTEVGVL